MRKFIIITSATWEFEVEAETEEEALELFEPDCYDNYMSDITIEEK